MRPEISLPTLEKTGERVFRTRVAGSAAALETIIVPVCFVRDSMLFADVSCSSPGEAMEAVLCHAL